MKKPREFIACKRTEKSSWQYAEYSEEDYLVFDAIAPDCGNFEKIRLREVLPQSDDTEAMEAAAEKFDSHNDVNEEDYYCSYSFKQGWLAKAAWDRGKG